MSDTFLVLLAVFAVVWLLSLFLEVYLTGKSDKLGLLIPVLSVLIPVGVLIGFLTGKGPAGNAWLVLLLSVVPTVVYFAVYRFCLRKKQEWGGNRN
ncbi:MAG: hypothetical protein ACOX7J_07565 [Bacillota bacterium]|jgi:hypothetical protein